MEKYINDNFESQEDRDLIRNGYGDNVTGLITELERLISLEEQKKWAANNLTWYFKEELAYLWACAKDNKHEKKFIEVFSGLNLCEWGRLVNLYIPLTKCIMGPSNDPTDYSKMVKQVSDHVQDKVVNILSAKFGNDNEKVKEIIVAAFIDFMGCRNANGGIKSEEWKMETQMIIAAFNQVFTEEISIILGKPMNGLIESYHYQQFIQYVVTAIISEPTEYGGNLTKIFIAEKILIVEKLLEVLKGDAEDISEVIETFKEKYDSMLDLKFISKENIFDFYNQLSGERKIPILKALSISKLRANQDFEEFMQKELAVVKLDELRLATKLFVDGSGDSLLKKFYKEWSLDKNTLDITLRDLEQAHVKSLVPKLINLRKDIDASKFLLNERLILKLLALKEDDFDNQFNDIVDNLNSGINLKTCTLDQIKRLFSNGNKQLCNKLLSDPRTKDDLPQDIQQHNDAQENEQIDAKDEFAHPMNYDYQVQEAGQDNQYLNLRDLFGNDY